MNKKISLVLLSLLLMLLIPNRAIQAQETPPGPQMEASLAWENYMLKNWTEIQIAFTNEGADWQGTVEVYDQVNQNMYQIRLSLPAHSQKQYRIPFYAESTYLSLKLKDMAGQEIGKSTLTLKTVAGAARFVCVVAGNANRLFETDKKLCLHTIYLKNLQQLPETPMVWDTVDLLIFNGIDTTTLTEPQKAALHSWVNNGGQLIISGGAALPQTLAGLPESLQIARTGAAFRLNSTPFNAARQLSGLEITPQNNQATVIQYENTAVGALAPQGLGKIFFLGWDLSQGDETWLGSFFPDPHHPLIYLPNKPDQPLSSNGIPAASYLMQVPSTFIPSTGRILLMLLLYIVLIGPLSWVIVRRLRRPILGWLLFPLWIVLALIIMQVSLWGFFSPIFPLRHEAALIYVPSPQAPARVIQSTSTYDPQNATLSWESQGFPRPLLGGFDFNNSYYGEGLAFPATILQNGTQTRVEVKHHGPYTWGTEGLTQPPALDVDWSFDGSKIKGQLTFERPFRHAQLFYRLDAQNTAAFSLDKHEDNSQETVPAGAPLIFSLTTSSSSLDTKYTTCFHALTEEYYYGGYSSSSGTAARVNTAQSVCYLGISTADVPYPTQSTGSIFQESCWLYVVPCPQTQNPPANTTLILTRDQLIPTVEGSANQLQMGTPELYLTPPLTMTYQLPAFPKLSQVTRLKIILNIESYGSSLSSTFGKQVELWNWKTETWDKQTFTTENSNLIILGQTTAPLYVDLERGFRIRIDPDSTATSKDNYLSIDPEIQGLP